MKLSALKKEILLVLLSVSNGGERLRPLTAGMIVKEIKERRPSSFKYPHTRPLNFVCVQRSLKRLARDGLINIDVSRNPYYDGIDVSQDPHVSLTGSVHTYYLNYRGKRKAKEIEAEIHEYVYKWWKFVEK